MSRKSDPPRVPCACGRGLRIPAGHSRTVSFSCQECLREAGVARAIGFQGGVRSSFTLSGDPGHRHESKRAEFVEVRR